MTRWYQRRWWYVERPFPLPLIAAAAVVIVAGITLGVLLWSAASGG